jgi:predicted Zn finger-like uncharacterized protein
MNVTCPNCATVYRVDPAKVPEAGIRARCAVCSAVFAVTRENRDVTVRREAPTPQAAPSPPAPSPVAPPVPPPAPPVPHASPLPPVPPPPAPVPPAPAPRPVAPAAAPSRPVMPSAPAVASGAPPRPAAPARAHQPAPPSAPQVPPQPAARPPAAPPGPGGRPANPFLSQDPSLKARRLARALVSDIVVYHPAKRQEGIRDGNLKELFEEEIKKSWEEYTEQVGREVAESTGFFREALNEILAGGRQLF